MKVLSNLSGEVCEGEFAHRGVTRVVDSTRPGVHRIMEFGTAGIVARFDKAAVAVPMAELWRLVEQFEDGLVLPVVAPLKAVEEVPEVADKSGAKGLS